MHKIIKEYFVLVLKYNCSWFYFVFMYLIIPLILSILINQLWAWIDTNSGKSYIQIFYETSWADFITLFSLISWFLLASISIILSSSDIDSQKIEELNKKFRIKNPKEYVETLKMVILHEIVFIFSLIILTSIIISFLKVFFIPLISYISIFFVSLSLISIFRLIKNFIIFEKSIKFTWRVYNKTENNE
jgi:hypothetical protein